MNSIRRNSHLTTEQTYPILREEELLKKYDSLKGKTKFEVKEIIDLLILSTLRPQILRFEDLVSHQLSANEATLNERVRISVVVLHLVSTSSFKPTLVTEDSFKTFEILETLYMAIAVVKRSLSSPEAFKLLDSNLRDKYLGAILPESDEKLISVEEMMQTLHFHVTLLSHASILCFVPSISGKFYKDRSDMLKKGGQFHKLYNGDSIQGKSIVSVKDSIFEQLISIYKNGYGVDWSVNVEKGIAL